MDTDTYDVQKQTATYSNCLLPGTVDQDFVDRAHRFDGPHIWKLCKAVRQATFRFVTL